MYEYCTTTIHYNEIDFTDSFFVVTVPVSVVNARDAMQNQGTIVVETAETRNNLGAQLAVLRVKDTGIGMDSDTIERLFEPFFTTKDAGQGTGLGLSTVYGLVSSSDGMISVESSKGKGSTFEISWPLLDTALDVSGPDCPIVSLS